MDVHAGALHALERLGHERGVHALAGGDLLHHEPERHHAVGHRQRVGVAQVDLLLARGVLVEAVLDRDAELLELADRLLAQVAGGVVGGQVEEAAVVERARRLAGLGLLEVEELDVGGDVEREPALVGGPHVAPQHLARIALERRRRRGGGCRRTPAPRGRRDRPTGSARTCRDRGSRARRTPGRARSRRSTNRRTSSRPRARSRARPG